MPAPVFTAKRDPKLRARILSERTLSYEGGSELAPADRPHHVRAGSGLAWSGEKIFVIQDDADYIAVIDGAAGGGAAGFRLRSPSGGKDKAGGHLQLEAVLSARDWRGDFILAFGSGSSASRRGIARVRLGGGDTELGVVETPKFYQGLEEIAEFATTTLNIEGVALLPKAMDGRDGVRLFHRANGKARGDGQRLNATVDIRLDALLGYLDRCKRDPASTLGTDFSNVRRYDLDEIGGVPFTFTDAATLEDGRIVYIACAERSEDADVDGECLGTCLGVIDPDGSARYSVVVERDGSPSLRKAEGIAVTSDKSAFIVIDPEDAEKPSTLCTVELSGV
ncbi:MAG: hypothetical protein EXR72_01370 [Myxococcales bacterium]|nr:hypothetical protein [Myxococcales bacterium]